uniref:PLD phosphodiesterase domain-containing protein n=1 Tax=Steinernema glaseri TaxID=37863 RepID=A0A1I8AVX3_9BILA
MIPIGETHDGRADMTNFEMDLFDTRINGYQLEKEETEDCCKNSCIRPACLPICIIALFLFMVVFFPLLNDEAIGGDRKYERTGVCLDSCSLRIVESIPTGLVYNSTVENPSTYEVWKELLDGAKTSIDFAVFYWNLRDKTGYVTANEGRDIFDRMIQAGRRGVKIRIAQNSPSDLSAQSDAAYLEAAGLAEVRSLNFSQLLGAGVLHTKFWIVDGAHVYLGSANMDWKSLTEVKELGVVVKDCACLASDLAKVFHAYWKLGEPGASVPPKWPVNMRTNFNERNPLNLSLNGVPARTYFSSSPQPFNPKGRENDVDAIVSSIQKARRFVKVAVMDYVPATLYLTRNRYWPALDDALKAAAFRGVHVSLLVGNWTHSRRDEFAYLRSLLYFNKAMGSRQGQIEVKLFTVPSTPEQAAIDHARVNHNKYMVTDSRAYIGTSNWAGDYFLNTAGVGLVIGEAGDSRIVDSVDAVFERDWASPYARALEI